MTLLGYAQFSQGFRAGGTNDQTAASIAGVTIPAGFGSDSVDNYEIGVKSTWSNRRLVANAAMYFMDWTDIQVRQQATVPSGLTFTYRGNGGAAEVRGLELELQAYPTDALQIGATFGYTHAELTEDLPVPVDGLDATGWSTYPGTRSA
jgi:outer membrane receptor protein involved in Fe transport